MIDKQQCMGLENALKNGMAIRFLHQGNEITINRCLIKETKLVYAVYINEKMYIPGVDADSPHYHPMAEIYSRKVVYNPYQRILNKMKKERGFKRFIKQKEYAYLLEKKERFEPFFPSAKAAVSHFKKIDGLTVKHPDLMEILP
ncbi:TPA: hypothetical protein ACGD4M_002200 [Serratia marcescens]